jgi:hypothetical protein
VKGKRREGRKEMGGKGRGGEGTEGEREEGKGREGRGGKEGRAGKGRSQPPPPANPRSATAMLTPPDGFPDLRQVLQLALTVRAIHGLNTYLLLRWLFLNVELILNSNAKLGKLHTCIIVLSFANSTGVQ